jgi:hypothetical protein
MKSSNDSTFARDQSDIDGESVNHGTISSTLYNKLSSNFKQISELSKDWKNFPLNELSGD